MVGTKFRGLKAFPKYSHPFGVIWFISNYNSFIVLAVYMYLQSDFKP
jgi:hypothetical protein